MNKIDQGVVEHMRDLEKFIKDEGIRNRQACKIAWQALLGLRARYESSS